MPLGQVAGYPQGHFMPLSSTRAIWLSSSKQKTSLFAYIACPSIYADYPHHVLQPHTCNTSTTSRFAGEFIECSLCMIVLVAITHSFLFTSAVLGSSILRYQSVIFISNISNKYIYIYHIQYIHVLMVPCRSHHFLPLPKGNPLDPIRASGAKRSTSTVSAIPSPGKRLGPGLLFGFQWGYSDLRWSQVIYDLSLRWSEIF